MLEVSDYDFEDLFLSGEDFVKVCDSSEIRLLWTLMQKAVKDIRWDDEGNWKKMNTLLREDDCFFFTYATRKHELMILSHDDFYEKDNGYIDFSELFVDSETDADGSTASECDIQLAIENYQKNKYTLAEMKNSTSINTGIKKENDTMNGNKIFDNFDFGKVDSDNIRASMYGLAVKDKSGKWVSFDPKNQQVIDVDALNFEAEGFAFKMPVALSAVKVSDLIYHHGNLMFVSKVDKTSLKAVDINCGEMKEIIPTRNMFNFNFVTKVVSLLSCFSGSASPDSPFGNLLPLMLMDGESNESMALPLMMMMMNQQGENQMQNMMLPLMMMGKGGSDMMLPMMLMMNGGQFPSLTPTTPTETESSKN